MKIKLYILLSVMLGLISCAEEGPYNLGKIEYKLESSLITPTTAMLTLTIPEGNGNLFAKDEYNGAPYLYVSDRPINPNDKVDVWSSDFEQFYGSSANISGKYIYTCDRLQPDTKYYVVLSLPLQTEGDGNGSTRVTYYTGNSFTTAKEGDYSGLGKANIKLLKSQKNNIRVQVNLPSDLRMSSGELYASTSRDMANSVKARRDYSNNNDACFIFSELTEGTYYFQLRGDFRIPRPDDPDINWSALLNFDDIEIDIENPLTIDYDNPLIVADGTEDDPYTVAQYLDGVFNPNNSFWVKGYIVGWFDNDNPITGAHFGATNVTVSNNILIAGSPDVRDAEKCVPVDLSYSSTLRNTLNLMVNPSNLGKEIMLYGDLYNSKYFYARDFKSVSNDIVERNGSEYYPYTVLDILRGNPYNTYNVWTQGYIVGWVEGQTLQSAHFDAENVTSTICVLIASYPDVKEVSECVPVQLPSGTVRNALNLQTNPGNLGKFVKVRGTIDTYYGVTGIKSASDYRL